MLFRHKSLRENPSHKLVISIALFGILKESKSWVNILNGFYGGPIMGKIGKNNTKEGILILFDNTYILGWLIVNIYNKISSLFNSESHLVSFFLKTIPKEIIFKFVIWNYFKTFVKWVCLQAPMTTLTLPFNQNKQQM